MNTPNIIDVAGLIGLEYEVARALANICGMSMRISSKDGVLRVLTRDYRNDRINVSLAKDIVVLARIG